jgi:hypothetical protein
MSILRPLLLRLQGRLHAALAHYLTRPVMRQAPVSASDLVSLSALLRNGDVLLTEGNTRAAALVKRLTQSSWSHVSLYVGPLEEGPDPRCIVEADIAAGVRAIRLSELEAVTLRVLRPVGLNEADRSRLAEWVVGRIGGEYDLKHAWMLARSLMPAPPKAIPHVPHAIAECATRFICSTLLANAFAQVGSHVAAADCRYVIPSDFERASGFEVVRT